MKTKKTILMLITLVVMITFGAMAQIPSTDGTPQETSWVENNGFLLKTQVSATSEYSGVTFTYTIFYTIPQGVDIGTVITITDVIPAPLKVETTSDPNMDISPVDDDITTPTTVTYTVPAENILQGTYNFQINVKFASGTTCNGYIADNHACMITTGTIAPLINLSNPGLCTDDVIITAVAVDNPYRMIKEAYLPYTGPDDDPLYQGVVNGIVTYKLRVLWKDDVFYTQCKGMQDLNNIMVTDNFPDGAVYVPNSFSVGDPSSPILSTLSVTTNSISFEIPYIPCWLWEFVASYQLQYPETSIPPAPSFPAGTIVENSTSFVATSCNSVVTSNTAIAKVQLNEVSVGAKYNKAVRINNPVPGCGGFYMLAVQNTGNVPFPDFTIIDDPIPSEINITGIRINHGYLSAAFPFTLNINNGAVIITDASYGFIWLNSQNLTVTSIRLDVAGGLNVLADYQFEIDFVVADNIPPGTIVNNHMSVEFDPIYNATTFDPYPGNASFTVEDYQPKICTNNRVYNILDTYVYGSIVRYQFSFQNIGSEDLIGAKVVDLLSSNLEYVPGSETYFYAEPYTWEFATNDPTPPDLPPPPIPAGTTPWNGVSVVQSGQTIEWTIPTLPANCSHYNECDEAKMWYYIEFNVRVKQYALAGSVPNYFTITGGNLPAPVNSSTTHITVNSVYGAQAEKFISVDNGITWAKTVTAVPGSEVLFRLQYTNSANYPVSDITLVDMLPMNYDVSDDRMMLNRATANNRGSQFELNYSTTLNSGSLPISMVNSMPLSGGPSVSVNNDYNICLPELTYSPPGCNSTPSWQSTGTMKNVKFDFGSSLSLEPGDVLTCDFKVQLPGNTPENLMAYNSFALISTGYYYILDQSGTSVLHTVYPLPAESDLACLISGAFTATAEGTSNYNGFNISCFEGNDGSAEAFPSGGVQPYSYLWNDPAAQTTKVATGLVTGTYTVIITDAAGNSATASCTLTQPTPLNIEAGADQTVYFGYAPAQCASLSWSNESGGIPPYSITWSTGETTQNITVCPTSTTIYTVTITDANNCAFSDQVEVCVMDIRYVYGNGNYSDRKVYVCHNTGSESNPNVTICIDTSAVAEHLALHGDMLGECGSVCSSDKSSEAFGDDGDVTEELRVYPNPSNSAFNFSLKTANKELVSIQLFDLSGRLLEEQNSLSPDDIFTAGKNLSVGIFVAIVTQGEFRRIVKIVKTN